MCAHQLVVWLTFSNSLHVHYNTASLITVPSSGMILDNNWTLSIATTQSHLAVTPKDGQTSTMLISKNDPELFCSTPNMTDDANIPIITVITMLVSSLSSGYIAVLLLLFKELRTTFGKLMIIYSITSSLASLNALIIECFYSKNNSSS